MDVDDDVDNTITGCIIDGVQFVGDRLDPNNLICSICNHLLNIPMRCICGHVFCCECMNKLLSTGDTVACPSNNLSNNTKCKPITRKHVVSDPQVTNSIMCLQVYCRFKEYGCSKKLKYSELQKHVDVCTFGSHCSFCKKSIAPNHLREHVDEICTEVSVLCQYKCGATVIRGKMDLHDCPLKPVRCKYRYVGCDVELFSAEMVLHEKDANQHMDILTSGLLELQRKIESSMNDNINMRNYLIKVVEISNANLKQAHEDKQALSSLVSSIEAKASHYQSIITKIQEVSTGVTSQVDKAFKDFDMRLQCTETANYEGVLMWKIGKFDERRKQTIDNKITSLISQPFYTSRYGYKMCARVYLNGYGTNVLGRYLSLFFIVMQGDYDATLKWPFRCKVTCSLIDQVNHSSNLVYALNDEASFDKPTTTTMMHMTCGCPHFVSLMTLLDPNEPYLQDDAIFLKVVVETSNLPMV
jgi:TNF receptor-associated factor 2